MVKFIEKIKFIPSFIKISFYTLKFAIVLGYVNDIKAKMLITQAKWHIHQQKNKEVKKTLLDFIDTMEETRFPNGKNNI